MHLFQERTGGFFLALYASQVFTRHVVATAAACLMAGQANAAPPGLEETLRGIRSGLAEEVAFREERHSDILTQPAIFEGRLTYDATTNVMSKLVESPVPVSMTVDERYVTVTREGNSRRLKLSARPELRALLAGFRGLLTGDTDTLDKHFELVFVDNGDSWRLTMTPRKRRLAKHVKALLVDGTADRVTAICTRMTNGDWQHMTLAEPPKPEQAGSD